jgi:DNA repair protein RecN (Recombination protein N)
MLETLRIENFGFIEATELSFSPGLNVVTGESGTGKSLVLDALGFVLGGHRGRAPFRTRDRALTVSGRFRLEKQSSHPLLKNQATSSETLELSRVLDTNGKATCLVNGRKVSRHVLAEVGCELVERSLQGDAHFLRQQAAQIRLVDSALGLSPVADEVRRLWTRHLELSTEERELADHVRQLDLRRDLLKYQLEEFDTLKLDNFEALDAELLGVSARIKALATLEAALSELGREGAPKVEDSLGLALRLLRRDPEYASLEAELSQALAGICAVKAELERRLDASWEDRLRHESLSSELAEIRAVARKHRVLPAELVSLRTRVAGDLDELDRADRKLSELREKVGAAHALLSSRADELHEARKAGVQLLESQIVHNMKRLNLDSSSLVLSLTRAPLGPHGTSALEMLFQSSQGVPFAPLGQIASGGEVSRVLLAILLTARGHAELLVLDEVDAGTGGRTAAAIGQTLAEEKRSTQVLCVTHSAQLASLAEAHFVVARSQVSTEPCAEIKRVQGDERIEELSRMLGGTEAARRHAVELTEDPSGPSAGPRRTHGLRRVA